MSVNKEAVLRGIGKKHSFGLNFERLDGQADAMDIITTERDDVELLEQALKEGRENIGAVSGGLKLRQGSEMPRLALSLGGNNSGVLRREILDTAIASHNKPRLVHAVYFISIVTLIVMSMFTLFDSMTVVEVVYKGYALAGLRRNSESALRDGQRARWRATRFSSEDFQLQANSMLVTNDDSEAAAKDTDWIHFPVIANDAEHLSQQIEDARCRENSTYNWAHIFGLPTPEEKDGVIRLPTGAVHSLRLVSFDSFGQRRCAGGDYYETDLRSAFWKSRPPVLDLDNGSYEVKLEVDPRFAGKFVFRVVLLFSNFDGLKQLDPKLSDYEYKKYFQDKLVANLDIEFTPPPVAAQTPKLSANYNHLELGAAMDNSGSRLKLETCKGEDFKWRQWCGRWTRGAFNSNCSIDSEYNGRFKCLDPETKCEHPWCEGAVGRLESNGWVYSAHCRLKIFSPDEAWQCLDGKWLFWWSDSTDQENTLVRDLLQSLLGLGLPEGRWDSIGRFSNKVFVRPGSSKTMSAQDDLHHAVAGSTDHEGRNSYSKQQVRMTNMWNANVESKPHHFQGVFSSYFTKFSSPDIVIMNSGLQDGPHSVWHNWTELVGVGVHNVTSFWKETFESILPSKHPRVVYTTTGAKRLSDFNPQVMEMYTRFLLDAYVRAKLTSDFRIVDGFDHSFSWMGRYEGNQHFVDLMLVHMLLNAICTVP